MGVAAIFGPQSPHTASHVQSICDTMEVPHLETRWDYRLRRESCLVNLYPHPSTLSKVNTPELLDFPSTCLKYFSHNAKDKFDTLMSSLIIVPIVF